MIVNNITKESNYKNLLNERKDINEVLKISFKFFDKIDFNSKYKHIDLHYSPTRGEELFISIKNTENENIKIWIMLAGSYNNLHISDGYVPIIEDHDNIKNDPLKLLDENLNLIFRSKIIETVTYYGENAYKFKYKLINNFTKDDIEFGFSRNIPKFWKKKKIVTNTYEPWITE